MRFGGNRNRNPLFRYCMKIAESTLASHDFRCPSTSMLELSLSYEYSTHRFFPLYWPEKPHRCATLDGIIGLGYVGLPLASYSEQKFAVTGFDIDQRKIDTSTRGHLIFRITPGDPAAK